MVGDLVAARRGTVTLAAKAVGRRAAHLRSVQALAMAAAARRSHSLVLLYHRIVPDGCQPVLTAVPAVPVGTFRAQLEALSEMGDIVPLERLLRYPEPLARPRFALTFDDDIPAHIDVTLPVLRRLGSPATFFLSGRALHGLPGYWFDGLDWLLAERGLSAVQRILGIGETTPEAVAERCEEDPRLQRILAAVATIDSGVTAVKIRSLVNAGMTIGFHTLHHRRLTDLDDAALSHALTAGRLKLEQAAGQPVNLFAYPHGRVDARVAAATERAGYRAAWTGQPGPVRPGDDRYRMARWEPGPLPVATFRAAVAVRLHRTAPT